MRFVKWCAAAILMVGSLLSADVTWNGVTYDDDTVSQLITVVTTTSPIKMHPSTACLEEAQQSLFINSTLAKCPKIIVFDGVNPKSRGTDVETRYEAYKNNVIELTLTDPHFQNTQLIYCPEWGHLCGAVAEAMKYVTTPFVVMHQHDLVLQKDVDVNGIVATMVANSNVKYVHFWGHPNHGSTWFMRRVDEVVEGDHFVPLTRCWGWSDQTHIASVDYYVDFVLPKCRYCFMEQAMQPAMGRSINEYGWEEGHRPFGTYLFGGLDDGGYIKHTDGRGRSH